ncbi:hypothetical protein mRhiFer1_007808 [Rhinolophus ferrumequinum]|uniref:SprT-like domain-containing protein n=1 Tax=Rhinolophus ferrumequinum TaxID=59479 RepID=A0A7J8AUF6_RHIFE|nr:hypothetical protein mRhiFer1_007808 [Rhinolophus ferrumequinum]
MDVSKEGPGQSKVKDDCCIIILDSSDEEFEPIEAGPSTQKKDVGCVVIDSDSDNEPLPEGKRAKVSKTYDILVLSDTDESSVIVIDDDSDMESPVIIEDGSCEEGQISSIKKEIEDFTISKHNASDDNGEQDVGEKLVNDPEAKLQISDTKMVTDEKVVAVAEQPRKRKCKGRNTCVTPAFGPSTKNLTVANHGNHENGNSNCNIPGCFFRDIEKSKMYSGKNFNKNKDELVQRIYILMNETVFNNKMPPKINVNWNKKMLRTAGMYRSHDPNNLNKNFGTIQISMKVCDSADRVRDTLIHELCHAATWLLHGIHDAHGKTWQYYARKSNMVHPELPMVTRCHNYKINYKIYYECVRCKYRLGRHTKSLDTNRFMCARCKGPLSLVPLTRKDGTPIRPHVRPFAKFVQQNYNIVQYLIPGIKHKQVMRTLSQEFLIMKQIQKLYGMYGPHPLLANRF